MVASCLSFVSLYGSFLRRCLTAGLSQTVDIDGDTTIHFWGPPPPLLNPVGPDSRLRPHGGNGGRKSPSLPENSTSMCRTSYSSASPSPSPPIGRRFSRRLPSRNSSKSLGFAGCIDLCRYSVVGTSYGGFVGYRMAAMWPERVEKVVIASSGVNMTRRDNQELLKRAKMEQIEELMLPRSAAQLRRLIVCRFSGVPLLYA
ncbi:UNVERIFIED_CONTAM: hypothetical protein Sangu_1822200 [Sesamum angustifolium]|uniref:AB hydrolase-1 domain-containing protein n=1 Tax=Sesamum angustifolium TaxID=2727405 RepID=A0AAW2M8C0_9LAMI